MARVNLRRDLFLGNPELERLCNTFQGIGAANNIFKTLIERYGIIRKESDLPFDALRVIEGSSASQITVKAGTALDKDINYINVPIDEVDILTVPTDSQTYYIKVKYDTTNNEAGTVDVAADGTLTGTGTAFFELLRGLPDFPLAVRFPNAVNNTGDYLIQSVVNQGTCTLNGASFVAESGLDWQIVGTFTPGVSVPDVEKLIYTHDYYSFILSSTDTVVDGEEFLLASVVTDGATMTITDLRPDYTLILVDNEQIEVTDASIAASRIVGFEWERKDNALAGNDRGQVQIGWGLRPTAYTPDVANKQILITDGEGGLYKDLSPHGDGDFDGWRCYFSNGKYMIIKESEDIGPNIRLTFNEWDDNIYPSSGEITIVPNADEIEFKITNALNPSGDQVCPLFSMAVAKGLVFPIVGSESNIKFRLKTGGICSTWENVGDGEYYKNSQFDSFGAGFLIPGASYSVSTGGNISPSLIIEDNFFLQKAWLNRTQSFSATQSFEEGTPTNNNLGLIDISAENGNSYEVDLVQLDVEYMTTQPIGTRIFLKFNVNATYEEVRLQPSVSPPVGYSKFYFPFIDVLVGGLGYMEIQRGSNDCWLVCEMQQVNGSNDWVVIGTSNDVGTGNRLDLVDVEVAQNASNISTNATNIATNVANIAGNLISINNNAASIVDILSNWTTVPPATLDASDPNFAVTGGFGAKYKRIGKTVFVNLTISGSITGSPTFIRMRYPDDVGILVNDGIPQGQGKILSSPDAGVVVANYTANEFSVRLMGGGSFANTAAVFQITMQYNLV